MDVRKVVNSVWNDAVAGDARGGEGDGDGNGVDVGDVLVRSLDLHSTLRSSRVGLY